MGESLKHVILRMAEDLGPEQSFTPMEAAQVMRPPRPDEIKGQEKWRAMLRQVLAEAKGLARQDRLEILRRGEIVDVTKPVKGLVRIRKKAGSPAFDPDED